MHGLAGSGIAGQGARKQLEAFPWEVVPGTVVFTIEALGQASREEHRPGLHLLVREEAQITPG
jgi:hypothetical protein